MIIPDVNLIVFAADVNSPFHTASNRWWQQLLAGTELVGLPWSVTLGFLRIMTDKRIYPNALPVSEAVRNINDWLSIPQVTVIHPGPKHLVVLERILRDANGGGKLVPDAHIAALSIEQDAVVHSHDSDFARFAGVRWHNPLAKS